MTQQTITVANASELNAALATATGGETILLAAGDYGKLSLSGTNFASNVTIQSADSNAPATISEMRLSGVSNLSFDSVVFDYTFNGEATSYRPFQIQNSSGITITDSVFSGDLAQGVSSTADGYGTGKGLDVRGSTDIVISGNEFFDWWKGVNVGASSNVTISGNDIHSIRSDGMFFDNVQSITIEKNYIHDFGGSLSSGDHRDMIQFSKISGPSSDIVIQDNVFDMGTGTFTQILFMGDGKASASDPSMFYQNVLIDNNMIYGAHTHGITVGGSKDLTISNNTVLAVDSGMTGGITIPKINVSGSSQNVTIDQNVVSNVVGYNGQTDWTVTNNALVQNTQPGAAGYYDDVFIYTATAGQDGYNQYGVVSGSVVDTLNAGSTLVNLFPMSYDQWVGSTGVTITPTTGGTGTTGTTGTGTTSPDPSTVDTSGSGTTGTGTTSPDTGTVDTSGSGTTGTGTTSPDTGTVDTSGSGTGGTTAPTGTTSLNPTVFDDFVLDISGLPGNQQASLQGDAFVENTASGDAIQFDGDKDYAKIGRLNEFETSEQIAFTVDFARDTADGSTQRLVWNHKKIGLTLTDDGLIAHVKNNDAKWHKGFEATNIGLNDTDIHQITMMVDQAADRLQVIVDDQVVIDETGTDFDFVGGREWGWSLGTPWGRYVDGEISAFAIDDEVQFIDQADDMFA